MGKRKPATKLTGRRRRMRYAARKGLVVAGIVVLLTALVAADRFGLFGRAPVPPAEKNT